MAIAHALKDCTADSINDLLGHVTDWICLVYVCARAAGRLGGCAEGPHGRQQQEPHGAGLGANGQACARHGQGHRPIGSPAAGASAQEPVGQQGIGEHGNCVLLLDAWC
eukprot:1161480-Pelagomonas_calceolata.AAC.26